MRNAIRIPLLLVVLIVGLGILFYPDISNWHNSRVHAELITNFNEEIAQMRTEHIQEHWQRAQVFNEELFERLADLTVRGQFQGDGAIMPFDEYMDILNVGGVMALVEIPAINVRLPVFHSTSHEVLMRGIGHLEDSSLPIGGSSTHAVLTAHTGLATHRLFSDLEEIEIGQLFFIRVLGETLAYEVDQLSVVLPHEIDDIRIVQGADHVTLITCTPYAVNSHRLLVRGLRIPYEPGMEEEIESILPEEPILMDLRIKIIAGILCLFLIVLIIGKIVRKAKDTRE